MATEKRSNASRDTATNKTATAEDNQVATSYDFSCDDAVTLIVGPEEKKMFVHGTYLTRDSDFFKAALKKEWIEGEIRAIKLPEEDSETMAHYMTFVYSNKLPFDGIEPKKKEDFSPRWPILIDLYEYGERFLCRSIQNAVIKEMILLTRTKDGKGERWYPTSSNVDRAYRGTPAGSPIRRLLVDMHVTTGANSWLSAEPNAQFLADLAKAFYEKMDHHKAFAEFRRKDLDIEKYLSKTLQSNNPHI